MPCEPSRRIVGVRVGDFVAEEEADRPAAPVRRRRLAACAAARRDRCRARAATPCRPARAARSVPASIRGSGRRDRPPIAPSARRSRAADRDRRDRASRGCDRAGCWRDARHEGCPGWNSRPVTYFVVEIGSGMTKMRNTSDARLSSTNGLSVRDDQIGRAQLPTFRERWRRRPICCSALDRSRVDPLADERDLAVAQSLLTDELARLRISLPWRHVAARVTAAMSVARCRTSA